MNRKRIEQIFNSTGLERKNVSTVGSWITNPPKDVKIKKVYNTKNRQKAIRNTFGGNEGRNMIMKSF